MLTEREREEFDVMLEKILSELPADVSELLETISLIVDDEPPRHLLRSLGMNLKSGGSDLCGLHSGLPLTDRSVLDLDLEPEVVRLFRGPIRRLADGNEKRLYREIRITLLHELGHHFGLTDERLRELGYG